MIMKKSITFLFPFTLFPFFLFAQISNLKGTVKDQQGNLLNGVTISINQEGKRPVSILSLKGSFLFPDLHPGKYLIKTSYTGYQLLQKEVIIPKDTLLIILQPDVKELKEVGITKAKPLIERKIDRVIYNVENSIISSGGTVWEALAKAPGVQTAENGSVTAGGKGVVIYLDDKPIRLSGEDLSAYLRNLPSDNISKLEIFTNPTAKFDAQGGAVINIISKKTKSQGLNVILNTAITQAVYSSYNSSAIFNYRKDKLNIYGNYGYSHRKKHYGETEYIIFDTPADYSYWDNNKAGIRGGNANNYRLGLDYNLTDKQVIGFLINGTNSNSKRNNSVITNIYNNYKPVADSVLRTENNTQGNTNLYSYNINYKAKLDTSGQTLNVDFDYSPYRNRGNQTVNNGSFLANGNQSSESYRILTVSDQKIAIWSGKADYTYTFNPHWNIESGVKYSSIITKNQFSFFNNAGELPVPDLSKTDNFEYKESTAAAYGVLNGTFGKWSLQTGLRAEYTSTNGHSLSLSSINKNNYLKFFPSLFLSYKVTENNEFNINYSRRINRPDYWRLNPFKYYTSPYTYMEGNPFLQPSFINSAELGYTYKQKYNFTFFYRQTNGYFSNITIQDNINKIFYDTQRNLDQSMKTGLTASVTANPADWLEINNYVQGSYGKEKSGYLEGKYSYHNLSVYMNTNFAFTIQKEQDLKAEISAWYSSPVLQGIFKIDRTYDVSAGIRKKILHKQGTIRLSVNDIFYGNPYRINVDYLNQRNGFYEKNDTRNIVLGFSYNLGNRKLAGSRKRETASEEEKKRTQ